MQACSAMVLCPEVYEVLLEMSPIFWAVHVQHFTPGYLLVKANLR